MRRLFLIAGTALLVSYSTAMAQTNAPDTATPPSANAGNSGTNSNSATPLRDHVRDMLQRAGFTDIHVMPSGFVIRAKDQDGNPVVMTVSPNSMTEISEVGNSDQTGTVGSDDDNAAIANGEQFVPVRQDDKLSSNLVGLDVYNGSNKVGQIKDVVLGPKDRARAIVVSVGGILGAGQHYVAMNPRDIQISYNNSDQKWHAMTRATADQLKSGPQFQYTGRWNASKS